MTKTQRKAKAINDLANAYLSGVVGVTEQDAREYAEFVWEQGMPRGFSGSEGDCIRATYRYEDM